MSQSNQKDVITLSEVAKRVPRLLKKLPHVLNGLILANDTRASKPMGLGWAFEKTVRQNPYGKAILYKDTELNYVQFNEWINQISHFFLSKGLQKGDVVAVFVENRPELLATVVALAKIGVTAALVNTAQTSKVLTHSINLVQPRAIVVGAEVQPAIHEVLDSLDNTGQILVARWCGACIF